MSARLWHYTCAHGRAAIGDVGLLYPARELVDDGKLDGYWPARYVWLTDLSVPVRSALVLTSNYQTCDRTAHRYRVTDPSGCKAWVLVRRELSDPGLLELADGARPRHWWVAVEPVPVVLDELE